MTPNDARGTEASAFGASSDMPEVEVPLWASSLADPAAPAAQADGAGASGRTGNTTGSLGRTGSTGSLSRGARRATPRADSTGSMASRTGSLELPHFTPRFKRAHDEGAEGARHEATPFKPWDTGLLRLPRFVAPQQDADTEQETRAGSRSTHGSGKGKHAPRTKQQPPIAQAQKTLTIAVFFFELIFKWGTTKGFFPSIFFLALFSVVVGQVLFLLTSLFKDPKVNHVLRVVLLVALGVAFGVEFFVFREFKVFYDLTTVTHGASHAGGQFGDQIFILMTTPSAILMICALMFPAIVAATLFSHKVDSLQATRTQRLTALGAAVAAHLLAFVLVLASGTYGSVYTTRYSFQKHVENFGLLVSLRKEVSKALFAPSSYSFGEEEAVSTADAAPQEAEPAQDTRTYGKSVLDIDFSALAQTTDGAWASIDQYVASQTPSSKNAMTGKYAGYNLIFISAEAFSAEAIRPDTTPTLYRMATKGIQFLDYYQPASAGTTGGEYQNYYGMLPTDGGASFIDTTEHNNELSIGWALNKLGYEGWAFHNNDYTYYDRDKTHNTMGYNNGYMGYGNGMEEYVEWEWPQSDLDMVKGTFDNLYGDSSPFNVYYMSVSGHSLYSYDVNAMSAKWEDFVEKLELPYSEPVRAYLACNVDFDRAMEYLVDQLEEKGIADQTLIVIAADHFPYGLDGDGALGNMPYLSELYGYDVTDIFQRDHNRLIMWSASMEDEEPVVVSEPTMSMDILPTLLNLFGVEWDSRLLPGRDVFSDRSPLVFDTTYDWKTDLGTYTAAYDSFVPNEGVTVPDGYVDSMNTVVANKINYCSAVLESDYMRHVYGDPKDVNEVNAEGKSQASTDLTGDPIVDAVHRAVTRITSDMEDESEAEYYDESASEEPEEYFDFVADEGYDEGYGDYEE